MPPWPACGAGPRTTHGRPACGGRKDGRGPPCGAAWLRTAGPASAPAGARRACGWLPAGMHPRSSSSGWFGRNRRKRWGPARCGARGRILPWRPGGDVRTTVCRLRIPDGRSLMIGRPFSGIPHRGRWACFAGLGVRSRTACVRSYPDAPRSGVKAGRTESRTSRRGRKVWTGAVPLWIRPGRYGRKNGAGRARIGNLMSLRASGGLRGSWSRRCRAGRSPAWSPRKACRPSRRVGLRPRTAGAPLCSEGVWRRQACRPWRAGVDCSPLQTTDRGRVQTPFAPQPWCQA
jgi:hypothetical protein